MEQKPKTIIFGDEVRKKTLDGILKVYLAVATTLSSRGRNISLEKNWGPPVVVHDGVTIAREVILPDPFENQAAQLIIQAAQKTNDEAGDGTTQTTILAYAIAKEAIQRVSSGTNPMVIRKGIDKAVEVVNRYLKDLATPVKEFEEMKQVATISAGDKEMGEIIATAIQKVGPKGIVTVQEGGKVFTEVEYKEGMDFDKGYISPYLANIVERMETVFEGSGNPKVDDNPYIIILNEKMDNQKLVAVLEKIYQTDQKAKVLIIADDYDSESAGSVVMTKLQTKLPLVAVRAPDFGEHRSNMLLDIAVLTGGQVLGGSNGIPLDQMTLDHIGRAEKIIVTKDQTIIVGGKGDKEEIKKHISGVETLKKNAKDEFQKDKFENRLAKLAGAVAVIVVGASSEAEMRERKERAYDAVNATKAAMDEGIVPGGGVAYVKAAKSIRDDFVLEEEERIGAEIVITALSYPLRKVAENSGNAKPDWVVGKVEENPIKDFGYNAETEQFENLLESGIIDPVKVTRTALSNAASVAIMLMTTEGMIAFERNNEPKKQVVDGIGSFVD